MITFRLSFSAALRAATAAAVLGLPGLAQAALPTHTTEAAWQSAVAIDFSSTAALALLGGLFLLRGARGRRWMRAIGHGLRYVLALTLGCAWLAPAGAETVFDQLVFSATGQSQWRNGAALEFNTHGPQFIGIPGFDKGGSIGEIYEECLLGACLRAGAKLGLTVSGRAGLNYDVLIGDGSLSFTLPQRVSFSVPDTLAIKQGGSFNIVSTLVPTTQILIYSDLININGHVGSTLAKPRLQTTGPTAQALVGMDLKARVEAVAQACFGLYCIGPNLNEGVDKTQELLSLNRGGNNELRVLGQYVGGAKTTQTFDKGSLSLTAQLPTINTDSRTLLNGFDKSTGKLTSATRANVLTLTANLDKIVSDLLGLPPLNGKSNGFGYNLLTANAGLNIDITQKFTFDPNLQTTLNFTSPVVQAINGVDSASSSSVTFRVGDTITLRAPTALSLGVSPVYTLDNRARNETGLQVDGQVNISAGGASIYGLGIGPLVKESAGGGLAYVPLFGEDFRVNAADIRTDPFNIMFAYGRDSASAESCIGLLGNDTCDRGGLFGLDRPCPNFPLCAESDDVYRVSNLYDFANGVCDGDCAFDSLGRPLDTPFAQGFIDAQIASGALLALGETSQFVLDESGNRVFLNGTLNPVLDDALLAVTSDTAEGSAQRLASLGFTSGFAPFDVPVGIPLPTAVVPEPGTLALFALGIAALGSSRRKQRGSTAAGSLRSTVLGR